MLLTGQVAFAEAVKLAATGAQAWFAQARVRVSKGKTSKLWGVKTWLAVALVCFPSGVFGGAGFGDGLVGHGVNGPKGEPVPSLPRN